MRMHQHNAARLPSPEIVYARQAEPGDNVLEIGSGPGYSSLKIARLVAPGGTVYAVDPWPEALRFLRELQADQGVSNILPIEADASALDHVPGPVTAVLMTMVLHHASDPAALVANVARLVPPGARGVIAEYDPDGPGEKGPTLVHRLAPDYVRAWCEEADFDIVTFARQSPDHYMFVVERRA
jgi:ubiquinone/menaquinone biosynthesis C-methylase UbiE